MKIFKLYWIPMLIAVVLILIMVGTVFLAQYLDTYGDLRHLTSVTVEDCNGTEYRITSSHSDGLSLFRRLLFLSTPAEMPDLTVDERRVWKYTLSAVQSGKTVGYTLFVIRSEDTASVGVLDENGYYYAAREADTADFLSSAYAAACYESAQPPTLKLASGEAILPSRMSWFYRDQSGEYVSASVGTTEETLVYFQSGNIQLSFDQMPNTSEVRISDGTRRLFTGTLEELTAAAVAASGILHVEVDAQWHRTEEGQSFGSVEYRFDLEYYIPTEFSLKRSTLYAGDYAVILCTHATDTTGMTGTVLGLEGSYSVTFVAWNGGIYGFLALAAECRPGSYYLVCTDPRTTATLSFTVEDGDHGSICTGDVSALQARDDSAAALIGCVQSSKATSLFLAQPFSPPIAAEPIAFYGQPYSDGTRKGSYLSRCTEYSVTEETDVRAVSGGTVVGCGSDSVLGRYVILSHGGNLYSCYCGLDGYFSRVGDTVASQDTIGVVASAMTVYLFAGDIPIDLSLMESQRTPLLP